MYARVTLNSVGLPICPNHGEQTTEYQAQKAPCGCTWFWGRGADAEYLVAIKLLPPLDNYDPYLHGLVLPPGSHFTTSYTFNNANHLFDLIGILQLVYRLLPPGPRSNLCLKTGRDWQQLLAEATGQAELIPFLEQGWRT